jgi:hypothetical protein
MPQIPQIIAEGPQHQRLGVAEAPQMPLSNPVDEATQQFGDKLAAVGDALQKQQDAVQATSVMEGYRQQVTKAKIDASTLPSDQQVPAFQQWSDPSDLYKNNPHLQALLRAHLPEIQDSGMQDIMVHSMRTKESEVRAQAENSLNLMAQNWIGADSQHRAAIGGEAKTIFDGMQAAGMPADERAKAELAWHQQIVGNAALAQAQADPGGVLRGSLDKNPDFAMLLPEQKERALSLAYTTANEPVRLATLAHNQAKAAVVANLDQMAANKDPGLADAAFQAAKDGMIDTGQQYRNYTGKKFREVGESVPGIVDTYTQRIEADPYSVSPADIRALPADQIAPNDRAKLSAFLYDSQKALQKPINAEYQRGIAAIRDSMTKGLVDINPAKTQQRVMDALSDFKAAKDEGFKSVTEVQQMRDQIIKNYGRPGRKPVQHVTPITATRAAAIAAGREAVAVGYDPTSGPE